MGDLISRQDDRGVSLKSVKHVLYDVCLHENNRALFSKLLDRVNKLRDWEEYLTIKQEPYEDAISRQALLDAFGFSEKTRKWGGDHSGYNTMMLYEIQDIIESQPSVKPQEPTGHCKDCKYFEYDSVAKVDGIPLIVAHEICNKWGDGCKTREDGYCFLFEPQERSE